MIDRVGAHVVVFVVDSDALMNGPGSWGSGGDWFLRSARGRAAPPLWRL